MKVVSTEALTKLIQLVKSAFIKVEDVVETSEVTLADVALSGDYDDLINKPSAVTEATVSGWGFTKNTGTVTSVNNVSPVNGNVTLFIPTVPTNVSAFTNDAGYITNSALTDYATESYVTTAVSGKQDTLVSGTGIDITNDVISVTSGISTGAALGATAVQPADLNGYATESYVDTGLASKQAILVSGTNIKTINNQSILGSGDLAISSRNIGEIVSSTIPLTDAGLHLLDGALISGSGSYADFVTYIAGLVSTYPDLFETEANWQTSVTNYGVCGKFVYDSVNNTVRLPKITGFVEGTTDLTALGDLIQAGLPNITDDLHVHWRDYSGGYTVDPETNTVFYYNGYTAKTSYPNINGQSSGSYPHDFKVSFDLSRGNPIYGNSNTVQPQALKVLYYIVIATSTKTEIEVDIDEIATDLNGKADVDLSNCTKPHIVETYVNGTSWYRVYSDGWIEQGGYTSSIPNNSTSTISLLKSFSNTNYSVMATVNWTGAYGNHIAVTNKQTSTFQLFNHRSSGSDSNSLNATWYTCGY